MRRNVDPDYEFDKDRFAEVLKAAIGDRSYSAFGKEADISFGYISKYINKKCDVSPTVQTLKKMAKVAKVTYAELLEAAGYDSNKYEEDDISDKSNNRNRKILQRTGSCIFENRKNPFNYKLKENEEYEKLNPNIKKPFFDNKNQKIEIKKKNKYIDNTDYEDEEFQKFVAYKGRFFIPADFRFGKFKEKRKYNDKFKKSKNEIDFII